MKKLAFFDQKHGLTPFEKCDFSNFKNISFHSQKKFPFYLDHNYTYFKLCFKRKQTMKKLAFFDQKHRLTPLEKCYVWNFKKFLFLQSKKRFFFLYKVIKHVFYSYFDQIHIKKNLAFFDQKHGLPTLEKCDFWGFEKVCFYTQKKFLFCLEHY